MRIYDGKEHKNLKFEWPRKKNTISYWVHSSVKVNFTGAKACEVVLYCHALGGLIKARVNFHVVAKKRDDCIIRVNINETHPGWSKDLRIAFRAVYDA